MKTNEYVGCWLINDNNDCNDDDYFYYERHSQQ